MCFVSLVLTYGQKLPVEDWDKEHWRYFQDLKAQAERLDEQTGQPDCHDPEKAKWEAEVEERLKKLEEKQ